MRKKLYILFVILAIAHIQTIAQDKYTNSNNKYELNYSVDWKLIPNDVIEKKYNKVRKSVKSDEVIIYDAGFQKRLSKEWFTFPYVLINIIETGRLSESDIKKIVGSFEKGVKEFTEDKSYKYKAIVKKLKMNDTYYDEKHQRLISMMDVKTVSGNLTCLMIMNLTSFGSINMYFYTIPPKYEYKAISEKKDIKTTKVTVENKENQIKNNPKEDVANTNEILYPILNFLFFSLPLLVFLFVIYRKNILIGMIDFINQYEWNSNLAKTFSYRISEKEKWSNIYDNIISSIRITEVK